MQDLIENLRGKSIHVVGVTGAEGSSILRFLVKHGISDITAHDFLKENTLEKSFKLWHKGLSITDREKLFWEFQSDLTHAKQNFGRNYLKDIKEADIVFIPQSWRLYKDENLKLWKIAGQIPFYSITRLYLDFAPAKIVAVTGTVGKGSVANIIFQLLKKSLSGGRQACLRGQVYLAGNDTWMPQIADKLDEMTKDDILVLEISHRQLLDGFTRAPYITVLTNLYPNHLDEVSWETYVNLKLSLLIRQEADDISVLNYDIPKLRLMNKLKSKVLYFSEEYPEVNTKSIQKIHAQIMNNKSDHYPVNLLAGLTTVEILGLKIKNLSETFSQLKTLPARMELLGDQNNIKIYDDIKSTTPWATLAGVNKLGKNTILICGGRTKGIDYKDFAKEMEQLVKRVIVLKSELGEKLVKLLSVGFCKEVGDLTQALQFAYKQVQKGDNILISPAAGFFYSDFIKGKGSLRKIITSLPPKEQA